MKLKWWIVPACLALAAGGLRPASTEAKLNKAPKGYKTLFSGKDLKNWQGLVELPQRGKLSPDQLSEAQAKADRQMLEHWSIKEGVLTYDGKGNSLQTAKDYGDFEMYVDWRIQKLGDSGIYLRGNPQVQIWDRDAGSAKDAAGNFVGSGGLFNNAKNPSKPIAVADKPAGEWNTFWIRMIGDRVTIKLNDVLVVDNTPLENYWEKGKPLPTTGPIELQHHGNQLEFRNIYLREIKDDDAKADAGDGNDTADQVAEEAPAAGLITLSVEKAPLTQVIQLLAQTANVEIILSDPDGKLTDRQMSFLSIKDKTIDKALDLVCRAAGLTYTRDATGIYFISLK